jgi:hypothetical protein
MIPSRSIYQQLKGKKEAHTRHRATAVLLAKGKEKKRKEANIIRQKRAGRQINQIAMMVVVMAASASGMMTTTAT